MPKNYGMKMGGEAGCVKQHTEEKISMLSNGGEKYSHNNPAELKAKSDALAKIVK